MKSTEKGFHMDDPFLLFCTVIVLSLVHGTTGASNTTTELSNGFTATPGKNDAEFEPLLADPTGVFAFGFWHVGPTKLDLAVIHLPSSQPVWRAVPFNPVNWAATTTLSFDGNLVLTDTAIQTDPIWSTNSTMGDYVVLRNTSNLEIHHFGDENRPPVWQSFDHPFDTLVQGQNFTALAPLFTADKRYTFRIGRGYIALYMLFGGSQEINYWKHSAVEANGGQLYGVVDPQGFFYLHNADGSKAEQIPFNSFNRGFVGLHRVTLQSNGNLNAYYWDEKQWVLDYRAISEPCALPGTCGSYGLCFPGQHTCSCLVNGTDGCLQTDSGDFCGKHNGGFSFVRRAGITVEYTDLMLSITVESLDDCEKMCQSNCSCWGALYTNTSKHCYLMDSPIQTVEVSENSYQGYFKLRNGAGGKNGGGSGGRKGHGTMIGLLVTSTIIFVALAAYGGYWFWDRRHNRLPRVQLGGPTQEMVQGPYKDLHTMSTT